jgi:hypothetical protein
MPPSWLFGLDIRTRGVRALPTQLTKRTCSKDLLLKRPPCMKLWLEGDEKGEVEDAASRAREEAMEKKGNGSMSWVPFVHSLPPFSPLDWVSPKAIRIAMDGIYFRYPPC